MSWKGLVKTRIESRDVQIVNESPDRDPSGTDIRDLATGGKLLDVYRAVVIMEGNVYEVTRMTALPRDYAGPALLERADRGIA